MPYTAEQLAIICPKCRGVGKCLDDTLWGSKYIENPHPERVKAAEEKAASENNKPRDAA